MNFRWVAATLLLAVLAHVVGCIYAVNAPTPGLMMILLIVIMLATALNWVSTGNMKNPTTDILHKNVGKLRNSAFHFRLLAVFAATPLYTGSVLLPLIFIGALIVGGYLSARALATARALEKSINAG